MSLRAKLLAAFTLVLVPVLAILAYELEAGYRQRTDTVLTDQVQTASAVAALVDATFDRGLAAARMLAADPVVQTMDASRVDPYLRDRQALLPEYGAIGLFDASGQNVGLSLAPGPGEPRPGIADRSYFRALLATGREQVSEVISGRYTARPIVILAAPVRGPSGDPRGALLVCLDLDRLPAQAAGVSHPPTQAILLADPAGRLAFHTGRPELGWAERDFSNQPDVQRALRGEVVRDEAYGNPLLGGERLAAFVATPGHHWVVGVSQAKDNALAPVAEGARRDVVAGAVALGLGLLLGLVVSQWLLGPIRRLTRNTRLLGQLLARGDDAPTRVEGIRTGDELEALGDSFSRMAAEVRRRVGEVEQANSRLAALVRIVERLASETDVPGIARIAVEEGSGLLAADVATLWLVAASGQELTLAASRGAAPELVVELGRVPLDGDTPAARAARTGEVQVVDDLAALDREGSDAALEAPERTGARALLALPLQTRRRLVGVLSYARAQPGPLALPERHAAEVLANVCAVALERAQLVEHLQAALRVREAFLNLAAHELKTPLTTFRGYAQVLMKRGGHDEEEQRVFRTINAQAERISRLIETLVDVSQIESGELVIRRSRLDLCQVALEAARAAQLMAPRHVIQVDCEESPIVEADASRLRGVLIGLLDNAVKYSPGGGPVDVTVRLVEREAVVAIRDRGIGIPADKQAQLFGAFYQVAPMVTPTSGMGLGLYIGREVLRRLGGRIWFESVEGQGSTFYVGLPAVGEGREPSEPIGEAAGRGQPTEHPDDGGSPGPSALPIVAIAPA